MILLNNKAAATTGGQQHPGINKEDGSLRLDYREILTSCGTDKYYKANLDEDREVMIDKISSFLMQDGIRFLQLDIDGHS
jgi:TPP-dependent indolepyruvate ferredoxin oxidoreductase alpha subunit